MSGDRREEDVTIKDICTSDPLDRVNILQLEHMRSLQKKKLHENVY